MVSPPASVSVSPAMYSTGSPAKLPLATRCSISSRSEQPGWATSADNPYISTYR